MTLSEVLQKLYVEIEPIIKDKTGKFRITLELNVNQGTIADSFIEPIWSRERLKDE